MLFPLVMGALSLGLGLLVEQLAGARLPGALIVPVGLAAMIAVASLAVSVPAAARLATPLVVALAVCGLVLGLPLARRLDRWALGCPLVVFAAYGASVLATGTPTFAGYIELDDTATFLALADRVLTQGRSLAWVAASTYQAVLSVNLAHGYPLGSVLPLGIGGQLLRTDAAWLYQPWLSFGAAVLASCLYAAVRPLVGSSFLTAAVALFGTLAALLYGFALWGGVKELISAPLLVTAAALVARARFDSAPRSLLPLAVVSAALLETQSAGALVWLLPLAGALIFRLRTAPRALVTVACVTALLAAGAIADSAQFLRGANRAALASDTTLGNLVRVLRPAQIAGIWIGGDFRVPATHPIVTGLLVGATIVGALVATATAWRAGALALPFALASTLFASLALGVFASPWVEAKAFAVASPVVLAAGIAGWIWLARALLERTDPSAAVGLSLCAFVAIAICFGVAWSDALAYHDVRLAPQAQLAELEEIGSRLAGQGPALMTEYQPYGVRHFLRRLDAEGSSELRRRPILLRDGGETAKAQYVDLDQIALPDLLVYRTLVLRVSPTESRPPAPYRLVWSGRWYEVWQRSAHPAAAVIAHLPLGNAFQPGAVPPCSALTGLARLGELAAVPRAANLVYPLDAASLPRGWAPSGSGAIVPARPGTVAIEVTVPRGGRYRLWAGGSVRGRLEAELDGVPAGSAQRQLQNAGQWLELGTARLARGHHSLRLVVSLPRFRPGTGGGGFALGPVLLQPLEPQPLVRTNDPAGLCGRRLDWVEAIKRGR